MKKVLTVIFLVLFVTILGSGVGLAAKLYEFEDNFDDYDFTVPDNTEANWWTSNQDYSADWPDHGEIAAVDGTALGGDAGVLKLAIDSPTMDYDRYVYTYADAYGFLPAVNILTTFDFMQESISNTSYDGLDIWFEDKQNEDAYFDFNIEVNTQIFGYHLPGMADETYVELIIPAEFPGIILSQGTWYTMSVGFWDWGTVCTVSEKGGDDLFSMTFEKVDWKFSRVALDAYGDPAYFDNFKIEEFDESIPSPEVPVPGALWLFGSGLLGMVGLRRRNRK